MTVRLYQDIDGCLNAMFNRMKWRLEDEVEDETLFGECDGVAEALYGRNGLLNPDGKVDRFRMRWNSRLIEGLNALDVEWVWTTTWRDDAPGVGKLMGLTHENVRVLHPRSGISDFPSIGWKYEEVLREQQSDPTPFIWVDDELADLPLAARERIFSLGGLMIAPDPNFGMTPRQVEMMREYISEH